MLLQLLLLLLAVLWIFLAALFGLFPAAPLLVGLLSAPPTYALSVMTGEQLRNLGRGLNVKQSVVQASAVAKGRWIRVGW